MNIAWIGTGVMGAPMAGHLQKAGNTVYVYNRSKEKAAALCEQGMIACDTIAEAVAQAEITFSMVGYPRDVEEIYLGPLGIFAHARKGSIAVDMTTSSPILAKQLCALGQEQGIQVLDAPVSGGDKGARAATLTIMVGGNQNTFDCVLPLFQRLGTSVHYMGEAGNGQHTKVCNQICVAGATAAYTEAMAYALSVQLDPYQVIAAIANGAAGSWQLNNMAPRALSGAHAPGFFVKHFIKDMHIAQDIAKERGLTLPMLDTVLAQYEKMALEGHQDEGTQALIHQYVKEKL